MPGQEAGRFMRLVGIIVRPGRAARMAAVTRAAWAPWMALGGTLIAGLSVIRCSGGSTMSLLPGSTRIVESPRPVSGAATSTSPLTGTSRVVPGLSAWPLSSEPPLVTVTLPPTGKATVKPPCPAGRLTCMIRAVAGFCLLKR